jgi:hypothetical protein
MIGKLDLGYCKIFGLIVKDDNIICSDYFAPFAYNFSSIYKIINDLKEQDI